MNCPKCEAIVGIIEHEIIMKSGVVNGSRCIICGYWEFNHPPVHALKQLRKTNLYK